MDLRVFYERNKPVRCILYPDFGEKEEFVLPRDYLEAEKFIKTMAPDEQVDWLLEQLQLEVLYGMTW